MDSQEKLKHQHPQDEEAKKIEEQNQPQKKTKLLPKKHEFRQRAHLNPFNDTPFPYPLNPRDKASYSCSSIYELLAKVARNRILFIPDYVNLKIHYPLFFNGTQEENIKISINTKEYPLNYDQQINNEFNGKTGKQISFVDVGCGYGGLLFALSEKFPEKLSFGIEIRDKLVNYVGEKIRGMRIQYPGKYHNIAVVRNNAMRHITNFFRQGQIEKLFFCFPDPNFKKKTFRRRIINFQFLSEYAYILKPKGRIYCITDVEQLHEWHVQHLEAHPQFTKLSEDEISSDPCIELIYNSTEEGIKVQKNNGSKFYCVYEKNEK